MTHYTIEELMAMDDVALGKAARQVFSMQFDPFSELGQRTMHKRLTETHYAGHHNHISPAIKLVIGLAATIIEHILNYQDALRAKNNMQA